VLGLLEGRPPENRKQKTRRASRHGGFLLQFPNPKLVPFALTNFGRSDSLHAINQTAQFPHVFIGLARGSNVAGVGISFLNQQKEKLVREHFGQLFDLLFGDYHFQKGDGR